MHKNRVGAMVGGVAAETAGGTGFGHFGAKDHGKFRGNLAHTPVKYNLEGLGLIDGE